MKHIKKFESFVSSPAPTTKPGVAPPKTKPGVTPNRPSPIRRDRPSVEPAPKAKLKMATAKDVVNRYNQEVEIKESLATESELEDMFSDKDWFHRVDLEEKNGDYRLVLYTNRELTRMEKRSIPLELDGVSVTTSQAKNID